MQFASSSLTLDDYKRYGRQMIIDGFGLPAQTRLRSASALVVGAGGLGCPALQYLCAAGIGRIGIVDPDVVETSNLQRQVLHSEATVGMPKVESAAQALKKLNSNTRIDTYFSSLDTSNAEHIFVDYDIVLDCSDNAPTRYLLSDTAVRLGKPLVSGAAQKLEGQLCTYNLRLGDSSSRGPCYRCLFPKPPAPENVGSCEETGILGAVTGVIGTLQALEATKILAGVSDDQPSMLIFSAMAFPPFRSIKLRSRKITCPACGEEGEKLGEISKLDYVAFCGGPRPDWMMRGLMVTDKQQRISAKELHERVAKNDQPIQILDVRPPVEFGICHLPNSINVPLKVLVASPSTHISPQSDALTVLVCRLGNDSQIAADALRENTAGNSEHGRIVDLIGGLRSWSADIDSQFPVY